MNDQPIEVKIEKPFDAATVNLEGLPAPPGGEAKASDAAPAAPTIAQDACEECGGTGLVPADPDKVPLTDEEAAAVRRAVVIGYYAESYEVSGRRYGIRTMTAADNKTWKAQHVITVGTLRKMYTALPLSQVDLEAMAGDQNVQRYVAYQIVEIDGTPVEYEQALAHAEKMSPIERGVISTIADKNAAKFRQLIIRSMNNKLKKF